MERSSSTLNYENYFYQNFIRLRSLLGAPNRLDRIKDVVTILLPRRNNFYINHFQDNLYVRSYVRLKVTRDDPTKSLIETLSKDKKI